jgi:hypothetical protein
MLPEAPGPGGQLDARRPARVEQYESVDSKYDHTADPVADILLHMG